MVYNIPTFARLQNPIKSAIIQWIEEQFKEASSPGLTFRMGDLEDGIREILKDPNLKGSTIRTHTVNLTGARPRYVDEITPIPDSETSEEIDLARKPKSSYSDRTFQVSEYQLNRLLAIQSDWNQRYPTGRLSRESR